MIEQPFYGEVALLNWHPHWNGNQYRTIVGMITVHQDKEFMGFQMRGSDSNWLAEVDGAEGTILIPGCKIAHIGRLVTKIPHAPGDTLDLTKAAT